MKGEIKAGDLVCVVKSQPCCGIGAWCGVTFTVAAIKRRAEMICRVCNKSFKDVLVAEKQPGWVIAVDRLLRIDPPGIDTEQPTDTLVEV